MRNLSNSIQDPTYMFSRFGLWPNTLVTCLQFHIKKNSNLQILTPSLTLWHIRIELFWTQTKVDYGSELFLIFTIGLFFWQKNGDSRHLWMETKHWRCWQALETIEAIIARHPDCLEKIIRHQQDPYHATTSMQSQRPW